MRKLVFICVMLLTNTVYADSRVCGQPERDADGKIKRSAQVLREFQKLYPCPSTGKRYGSCPGWAKDHVIPLASCGCDSIENLQWLPTVIKSCNDDHCKDRGERKIYRCNT